MENSGPEFYRQGVPDHITARRVDRQIRSRAAHSAALPTDAWPARHSSWLAARQSDELRSLIARVNVLPSEKTGEDYRMKMSALAVAASSIDDRATLLMMAQPGVGEGGSNIRSRSRLPMDDHLGAVMGQSCLSLKSSSSRLLAEPRLREAPGQEGDIAQEFHIVTYDLRGHGISDKPLDPAR